MRLQVKNVVSNFPTQRSVSVTYVWLGCEPKRFGVIIGTRCSGREAFVQCKTGNILRVDFHLLVLNEKNLPCNIYGCPLVERWGGSWADRQTRHLGGGACWGCIIPFQEICCIRMISLKLNIFDSAGILWLKASIPGQFAPDSFLLFSFLIHFMYIFFLIIRLYKFLPSSFIFPALHSQVHHSLSISSEVTPRSRTVY